MFVRLVGLLHFMGQFVGDNSLSNLLWLDGSFVSLQSCILVGGIFHLDGSWWFLWSFITLVASSL